MPMPTIRIVTDSSCDLPQDIADEHGIVIVPLTVRFGEEEFVDRRDLTPEEFWRRVKASPTLPETAAPSPGAFEEAFRQVAGEGAEGVVCITLSGALSATFQAAELAAKSVADTIDVRVVDSRAVTMALGNICLAAAERAETGASLDDVVRLTDDLVTRTRIYATFETLDNLKKGGRIGGAQAFVGSLLSIKPVIELREGRVEEESKQRTRSRSLRYLAEKVKEAGPVENLAVCHGDAKDIDDLVKMLEEIYAGDILVAQIGAVIGTHGGPGVVGVTFHLPPTPASE